MGAGGASSPLRFLLAMLSEDLLWRVVYLWRVPCFFLRLPQLSLPRYFYGWTQAHIEEVLFVSANTVRAVLRRFKAGKALTTSGARRARGKLTVADLDVLRRLLLISDALFLDELQLGLFNATGKQVSLSCVVRGLAKLRITRKQVRRRERAAQPAHSAPAAAAQHCRGAQRGEAHQVHAALLQRVPLGPVPLDRRERPGTVHSCACSSSL